MAEIITITANWNTGSLSNRVISRQYDNNRYRIQFMGYPEDTSEDLIFYLLVWMRTEEHPQGSMLAPIQMDSDQWLISNYFTQKEQQIRFQLCIQNESGTFEAHSPIFNGSIQDSLDHDGEDIDIDTSSLFDYYREYVNELIIQSGAVVIDTALDANSTNPVQNKIVAGAITELNGRLDSLGDGVPTEVRQALVTLLTNALYNDNGLTDEKALLQSWAAVVTAIALNQTSISINGANTTQLVATTTPAGGTVTWASSDTSVATVVNGLVTGVGNGSCTITASCGGKRATCSVTVSGFASLTGITATYTQSGTVYNTDTLDSLKSDLVVTATYSDSTTRTLSDFDYTLSGTLEVGTSTIAVSYGGKTATFNVTVTEYVPVYPFSVNQAVAISGLPIASGMINDSGEVVASNNSYFIDSFVDAETVVYFKDGDIVALARGDAAVQGRSAYYDASDAFISRKWISSGNCITPAASSSKQKVGWTATSNPDYYVVFSIMDDALFINDGKYLGTNGELAENASFETTDYLDIEDITKYLFVVNAKQNSTATSRLCFYDANKVMLERYASNQAESAIYGDIPTNAKYFRLDRTTNAPAYSPFVKF